MNKNKNKKSTRPSSPYLPFVVIGIVIAAITLAAVVWIVNGALDAGSSGSTAAGTTPQLVVDQDTIDLGDVKLGRTVQATFNLKNGGGKSLKIAEKPIVEVVEGC